MAAFFNPMKSTHQAPNFVLDKDKFTLNTSVPNTGVFFNRETPSSYPTSTVVSGRADDQEPGTFKIRYIDTYGTKNLSNNYSRSIIFSRELPQVSSLFRRRCEDYVHMKKGTVPPGFSDAILNYISRGHLNPRTVHSDLVKQPPPGRPGNFFGNATQTQPTFVAPAAPENTSSFFRTNDAQQSSLNVFFNKKPAEAGPVFGQGLGTSPTAPAGDFFNKGGTATVTPGGGVSSFFANSAQQQPKGNFFGGGATANAFGQTPAPPAAPSSAPAPATASFFANANASNEQQAFGPAPRPAPTQTSSFFPGNSTSTALNAPKPGGSFFTPQQSLPNPPQNKESFFAGNSSSFGFLDTKQSQSFAGQHSTTPSFAAPPMSNGPPPGYFGQPPMAPYPPYPMVAYPPYYPPPYPAYYTMPEPPNKPASESKVAAFRAAFEDKDVEKAIEQAVRQDFRKKLSEIERENYFFQKYIANLRTEISPADDVLKLSLKPLLQGTRSVKSHNPAPLIKSRMRDTQASLLSSKEPEPPLSGNQTLLSNALKSELHRNSSHDGLVRLKIAVHYIDSVLHLDSVTVNKSITIRELKSHAVKQIPRGEKTFDEMVDLCKFSFDSDILSDDTRLKAISDLESREVQLIVDMRIGLSKQRESMTLSQPAPKFAGPVFTKPGYEIYPSLTRLQKMNERELSAVENFIVRNEYGKIKFAEAVDLREANIDLWVLIKKDMVEVYPEDLFDEVTKPEPGSGLNVAAHITLYGLFPRSNEDPSAFLRKLRAMCERQGAEFIKYNAESGKYKFKVPHF